MAVLCRMSTIQYSAGSGPLYVHQLFTSCIRRCLVSRACNNSDVSVNLPCYLFSVSNSDCFSSISVAL